MARRATAIDGTLRSWTISFSAVSDEDREIDATSTGGPRGEPGGAAGRAVACPPGTALGGLGGALAIFLLLPAGAILAARRRPEMALAAIGLPLAGVAAAVYASRFVADPITTSTRTTWWFVGVCGTIALLSLAVAFLVAGRPTGEQGQETG